ncbi:hypothetical protein [Pseudonocardia sp. ICBG601]|uniref:hypothetical protein n=1 Tax=Pseudonocardia sp. ICBG601 TaxID=2846759 RepID=UPI001CF6A8CF|nr:hypothetical protein [Pseudonocardia sp. ICBG601]
MTSTYGTTGRGAVAGGPAEHAGAVAPGHADPGHADHRHSDHAVTDRTVTDRTTVDHRPGVAHHPGGVPVAGSPRLDRIRWGAVWIGALTTFATNIVLQLLFFAFGWLAFGGPGTTTAAVVSVVIGLLAFFLGGMATGSSTLWDSPGDGVVNALAMWVLTTMLLVALALAGGGALAGYAGSAFAGMNGTGIVGLARDAAGWSVLGMGVTAAAAAIGGAVGARLWPGAAQRTARI